MQTKYEQGLQKVLRQRYGGSRTSELGAQGEGGREGSENKKKGSIFYPLLNGVYGGCVLWSDQKNVSETLDSG